ncbi:hypothetical protein PhCBS80983_g05473 [Powellomyces hirtus]|uniref:Uncharacterized protein n=1 Tax=Powellomyces hirtus TaxID=109895 RepID=A0A507DVD4_9FUNG|nr:hypothetical protein PhCBS80983_g05473 [Powellomyces hirtus]
MEHERAFGHLQTLDQTAPLVIRAPDLDSTNLLKNLDELRKMQIDLAMEHLALGSVPAERVSLLDMEQDEDSSRRYKRNAERFAKKEADVNSLMIRLEELSEAM